MSLSRDRDLTRRMGLVLALVLLANVAFVGFVVAICAPWIEPTVRANDLPDAVVAAWWVPPVLFLLVGMVWTQLRYVRTETLRAVEAREVAPEERPDLHGRVTRLATAAAVPTPELYLVDSPVPNCFALDGVGPPAIVVSEGLLDEVADAELDAVLAHEFAHVENRDATVMTLASFLPALASDRYAPLADLGTPGMRRAVGACCLVGVYLAGAVAVGTSAFDPGYAATFVGGAVAAVVVGGVALGVFATLTTFAARRLSHYREFAADRGAAALTGDPAALADALVDLDPAAPATPETDKRRAYREVQGLCLLPHGFVPGTGPDGDAAAGPVFDGDAFHVETRTHPPTDERIERLRRLVEE